MYIISLISFTEVNLFQGKEYIFRSYSNSLFVFVAVLQQQPRRVQRTRDLRVRGLRVQPRALRQELRVFRGGGRVSGAGEGLPAHQRLLRPAVLRTRHLHLRRLRVRQHGGRDQGGPQLKYNDTIHTHLHAENGNLLYHLFGYTQCK